MKRGLWIALEGGDAVGKSTQAPRVATELRKQSELQVVEVPEFSDSPIGIAIATIISRNRFFSLENKTTPLADILTTFSDLAYLYEKIIFPTTQAGGIALSDRSPASPLAYQLTSRSGKLDRKEEKLFLAVASLISKYSLVPDLSILLCLPEEEMVKRVVGRGEIYPTVEELTYLDGVQTQLKRAARLTSREVIEADGGPPVEIVTASIIQVCLEKIAKNRKDDEG